MTLASTRRGRRLALLTVPFAAAGALSLGHAAPALAAASTSSSVGYLTDAQNGGFSLWSDGFGITAPADGGSYSTHTPATALTVTIHNISMSTLDVPSSTALTGPNLDTLVMFDVCDIAAHPNAMKAVNSWVDAGHKLVILDGAQCTDTQGGVADWSTFIKPFTDNYVDPVPQQGASTPYSFVGETGSQLTTGFPDCTTGATNGCEPGNAIADASILSANSPGWCTSLAGTSANNVSGPVEAYTRTAGGGLIVYEGEAYTWSVPFPQNQAHLRLAFDDFLNQAWNPDSLTCGRGTDSLVLTPKTDAQSVGNQETLTATVTNSAGTPVSGAVVTFTLQPGSLNSGLSPLTGTTNASGVATAHYTSSKSGATPDTWVASFSDTDNHVSYPAKISWTPPVSVPETRMAVLVPVVGAGLLGGLLMVTVTRRRRRASA